MANTVHTNHPKWLSVSGSSSRPTCFSASPMAGSLAYDQSTCEVKVYTGYAWETISNYTSVDLTPDAAATLEWANRKRMEEQELDQLADKYPLIRELRDQLEAAKKLVGDYEHK